MPRPAQPSRWLPAAVAAILLTAPLAAQDPVDGVPVIADRFLLLDSEPKDNVDPARYTNDLVVHVKFDIRGGDPATAVEFSPDETFADVTYRPWDPASPDPLTWQFPDPKNGPRVLWARLVNAKGEGNKAWGVIELDTFPPDSRVVSPEGPLVITSPIVPVLYDRNDRDEGANDKASGVKGVNLIYSKDGEPPQQYNGEFSGKAIGEVIQFDTRKTGGPGHYELWTVAIDKAGNREARPPEPDVMFDLQVASSANGVWSLYE